MDSHSAIEMPDQDEYGVWHVKESGRWKLTVQAMLVNDRVTLTEGEWCEPFHWCYPKGGRALLAAVAWNPDVEAEPELGWIKRLSYWVRTLDGTQVANIDPYGEEWKAAHSIRA